MKYIEHKLGLDSYDQVTVARDLYTGLVELQVTKFSALADEGIAVMITMNQREAQDLARNLRDASGYTTIKDSDNERSKERPQDQE